MNSVIEAQIEYKEIAEEFSSMAMEEICENMSFENNALTEVYSYLKKSSRHFDEKLVNDISKKPMLFYYFPENREYRKRVNNLFKEVGKSLSESMKKMSGK